MAIGAGLQGGVPLTPAESFGSLATGRGRLIMEVYPSRERDPEAKW